MHPTIGLDNQQQSPYRIAGWIGYCGIESFGSVMVSLFWSFANSNFFATSYALNNPTKEVLYQPTSSAIKYKAKSWILISLAV
jgi:ATP/ADP translocase